MTTIIRPNPKRTHKRGKSASEKFMQQYLEKAAEILKPAYIPSYEAPKPIRFSNAATVSVNALAADILSVLEGHTIEEIVSASNVVEQFVLAQSKGQYFTYSPVPARSI